ncbi:MAG: hypothetical protein AAFW75_00940 [Cyanobacteria bacterium J06636_16]
MCTSVNSVNFTAGKFGRSHRRSLLSLLEFPALERRVLITVLRQGPIALSPLIEQCGQTADIVMPALERLMKQGWIVPNPVTHNAGYSVEDAVPFPEG